MDLNVNPIDIFYQHFSKKQKEIVDCVSVQLNKSKEQFFADPLRVIVNASGGCGKSTVLTVIKQKLVEKQKEDPTFEFIIAAYTGIAAKNINSATIHSAFHLPQFKSIKKLNAEFKKEKKANEGKPLFENVRFIIFDESSLIGLRLFHYLNNLLQDSAQADYNFGNKSLMLFGDCFQPLCIADFALFSSYKSLKNEDDALDLFSAGKFYREIKQVFILDEPFRQHGSGQFEFLQFLERLRRQECSEEDYKYVKTRLRAALTAEEQRLQADAITVFPTNWEVDRHNL